MKPAARSHRALVAVCLVLFGVAVILFAAGWFSPSATVAIIGSAIGVTGLWRSTLPTTGPTREQQVIAQVSHELLSPLTSILGILDLVTKPRSDLDPEETVELLSMANEEARHMMGLVRNLHTVSRLAGNHVEPIRQPVDLVDLGGRVIDRFPEVARRTYVPRGEVMVAWADPQLAMQIITNLVQNAGRYAPDGEIEMMVERRENAAVLSISDDGPGINPEEGEELFAVGSSHKGLGIGLSLSRQLARAMDGDLILDRPLRQGATFSLVLPFAEEAPEMLPAVDPQMDADQLAMSPRSRLLVDMAAALSERSLDRTVAGLRKLYVDLLNAVGGILFVPIGPDLFRPAGSFGEIGHSTEALTDSILAQVMRTSRPVTLERIKGPDHEWHDRIGGEAAIFLPVLDLGEPVGVMVISWANAEDLPRSQESEVAHALAQIAAFAIHRSNLVDDVAYERGLRASVMESLPIAISVFAGDPPRVVDWNRRERRMLGIQDDVERPANLHESQHKFEVRFADGRPLTVDNAPVTAAIRTGDSTGPFLLVVRRADGTHITTRTYCAPFFDEHGKVAGAVVTSEELDILTPATDPAGDPQAGHQPDSVRVRSTNQ